MRDIEELYEVNKEDLPELYCDMDMVLVDFLKGAEQVMGEPFATADRNTRWDKICSTKGFWENLDWMPGAKKLYQRVAKYDTHILSAYSGKDPSCKGGKMKWLGKNTRVPRSKIHLVRREDKKAFAKTRIQVSIIIEATVSAGIDAERMTPTRTMHSSSAQERDC